MRYIITAFFAIFMTVINTSVIMASEEEPIKHLEVPEIISSEEAKRVFIETTSELRTKTKLDASELHEIHIITYSLEKAIAYFAENMKDEQQAEAKKMAEVVELVHLDSENNRATKTREHLDQYFNLADAFSRNL